MVKSGNEVAVPPESQGVLTVHNDATAFLRRIVRNLGTDARMGINLFPTIRIPGAGNKFWEVLDENGNSVPATTIEGVICHWHASRAYWVVPYNERTADSQKQPDCRSLDARMGIGNPGIACKECPFAAWGSGRNGVGSACNQMRNLYILRDGMFIPNRVVLPVTSISNYTRFMAMVTGINKDFDEIRVSIGLEQDESTVGDITYSKATFKSLGFATPDAVENARRFGAAIDMLLRDPAALEEFVAA